MVDTHLAIHKPWVIAKRSDPGSRDSLENILYVAAESIRIITALLHPIMPYATSRVWAQLGLDPAELITYNLQLTTWGGLRPGTKLGPLSPIFPRADKSLIEIMTNMEEQNAPTTPAAEPTDSTHPAAGPRPIHEPTETLPVGGSTALTTHDNPVNPVPPPAPAPAAPATPSTISIDDFAKVELRVAQIVVAERIPKADKLLRLEVDLGPDFPRRQILSGIAEHYTPEELIGRRIVVVTNLAPRKMRGLESHGMLLAASHGENGKPILATFADSDAIALGSRLK
jgi:methionyl-tRNA synthetase